MIDWLPTAIAGFSTLVAVGSLFVAILASKRAQTANSLAEAANRHAVQANQIAGEANAIAVEANEIASEAKTIHQRDFELTHEQHVVRWEFGWEAPGVATFTNVGQDEARRVAIELGVDGAKEVLDVDRVAAGEMVRFAHGVAREKCRHDQRERERARRATSEADPRWGPAPISPTASYFNLGHHAGWHISWVTQLGQPRSDSDEERMSSLGGRG